MDQAKAIVEAFQELNKAVKEFEAAISKLDIPITETIIMPFGKHRGEDIDNVPAGYLDWLRDQAFVKEQHPKIWNYINANSAIIDSEIDDYDNTTDIPF